MSVPPDFPELLKLLHVHKVEHVVVGAFALAHHGRPRATGDINIWVRPTKENAARLLKALGDFGFASRKLTEDDILSGQVIQLGYPPVRVDILTSLDGVGVETIWAERVAGTFGDVPTFYLSRACLIANKRAVGRPQDLADIDALSE